MNEEQIIDYFHQIIVLTGNPYLEKIFEKYKYDKENLCLSLSNYIKGIYENVNESEEEQKIISRFIYIKNVVLDVTNISRIELNFEYNSKKNKNIYKIKIIKKYPTPLEEDFSILFDSEEDRDYWYDILKGKLKLLKIYIL